MFKKIKNNYKSIGLLTFLLMLIPVFLNLIICISLFVEEINMGFTPGTLLEMGVLMVWLFQLLVFPIWIFGLIYFSLVLLYNLKSKWMHLNLSMVIITVILFILSILLIIY